ncbi:MAG: DUF4293 domain-containing protein [Tannerella sp.]|jgi:hypothetical protein|nr:DUF4293 domain-containing protein [Tannerella sp.]
MIQRIQTVYLLIVAALFAAIVFLPLASLQSGDYLYNFDVTGLNSAVTQELVYPTWSLLALACIVCVFSFTIIFMYKKRVTQIRLCVYNALLIIGFCLLFGFYLWRFSNSPDLPDLSISIRLWVAFPIIALIINYLALRNIGADEAMIRSLERLR